MPTTSFGPCSSCQRIDQCGQFALYRELPPGAPNPHAGFGPDHMTDAMLLHLYGTTDLCAIYNREIPDEGCP